MPPQVEGRAAPPRAPQSAKHLYRSKAPERGEFFRRKKRGKPQVGFPLFSFSKIKLSEAYRRAGSFHRYRGPPSDLRSKSSERRLLMLTVDEHPRRGLNYRFLLPVDDIQSGASRPIVVRADDFCCQKAIIGSGASRPRGTATFKRKERSRR